ncbi:MAG: AI-2E family transporter [Gemmatimonadetes bacterium]|nr:AI-2E family transporter [Gemmatimonadota bacterium]
MNQPAGSAPPRRFAGELRYLYGAVVLAVVGLLLYTVAPVLSPVVLYLVLVLLVSPYAGSREHVLLIIAATVLLLLWLLHTLGSILAPFLVAFALAYILDPAADALERRGVGRGVAVALLVVPVLVLLGLALVFGIPVLGRQAADLIQQIPAALTRVATWLEGLREWLLRLNLPFIPERAVASLQIDETRVAAFIEAERAQILARAWSAVLGVGRGFGFLLTLLGYLVLTPVVVIYLLRDFNRITTGAAALLPPARRARWLTLGREYDTLLGRFLRGQVLEALIVGVLTWVGLLIAGFPYAGLVAATAGVFNLVPYLGLVVSIIPVLVIALLSGSFLTALVKAGIVFVIVQTIDSSVTGPRIVGGSVGLHPVWVMLALAIGSFFFGFVGLLLAVPAAVLIKLAVRETLARVSPRPAAPASPTPAEPVS